MKISFWISALFIFGTVCSFGQMSDEKIKELVRAGWDANDNGQDLELADSIVNVL